MKKRCKHENADHLMPGDRFQPYARYPKRHEPIEEVQAEQFRCLDCGHYLSLGPANMTDEAKVELRAAEIAADLEGDGCMMSMLERCGFNEASPYLRNGMSINIDSSSTRAGYLARIIAEHSTRHDADGEK